MASDLSVGTPLSGPGGKYTSLSCQKWIVAVLLMTLTVNTTAEDEFNYRSTSGSDFGPKDWDRVGCDNLETCPGWPTKLEGSIGWKLSSNNCRWCPIEGNGCGQHRQSPIDLQRDRALIGGPNYKDCPDWHWISYLDGSCYWNDVIDQFFVDRDALRLKMPITGSGDINCVNEKGERKFPKVDFSKGFPDWWYLSETELTVPSEHTQQGQRYAGELKLHFFYEIDHYKNKAGTISFLMQDLEGEPAWPYLDKLICQWRKVEEAKRSACGLEPAPVYKMCELFRGQTRSAVDLDFPSESTGMSYPTIAPLVAPKAIPINKIGADPPEFTLPLQLCQGDCDFPDDCAPGLICFFRGPFDAIPGCIGGESDGTNTDYCVFDPYGDGYSLPTPDPTPAPTITSRPSLSPLPPKNLYSFGGSPPLDKFPLQLCQGDCDNDDHCAEGLICFQRNSNQAVPGCIGGEDDIEKTDYCILDPYGQGYVWSGPEYTYAPTPPRPVPSPTSVSPAQAFPAVPTQIPIKLPSAPISNPRPTGDPLNITNLGWEPPYPLGECEGDCDTDEDCGPGLYCYQRNQLYESVPGCAGGESDATLTDYCAYKAIPDSSPIQSQAVSQPTGAPIQPPAAPIQPTAAPIQPTAAPIQPTAAPIQPPAVPIQPTEAPSNVVVFDRTDPQISVSNLGWSPGIILGECEGDCDTDEDCADGLICFQRNANNATVPGCAGGELDDTLTDFCISDKYKAIPSSAPPVSTPPPFPSVTDKPTEQQPTQPASVTGGLALNFVGWSPPEANRPLGRCEGDCDIDDDCEGDLVCFQRFLPNVDVPGCTGGASDEKLVDYCIDPNDLVSTSIPVNATQAPSPTNTAGPAPNPIPSQPPNPSPTLATDPSPTEAPNQIFSKTTSTVPPPINCGNYNNVNFFRMCKDGSCCENPRSASQFCHESYEILGNGALVESACYHCCLEEQGVAKEVGLDAADNPALPRFTQCSSLENAERMCKDNSCCSKSGSGSFWCQQQFAAWQGDEEAICWYCCYPSRNFTSARKLAQSDSAIESPNTDGQVDIFATSEGGTLEVLDEDKTRELGPNDRVTYDLSGRKIILREENFEKKGILDEDAYFDELFSAYQRRLQQVSGVENYDDVHWWPFEWFLKVGTEYYFRYEGTQTTPPCYETIHWRVFKDPIRVAPHQMRELERLIAQRLDDNCRADTAGVPRNDGSGAVDVNRPLQSTHKLHREVFCECQDWPSKFPADRQWCRNWKNKPQEEHLFQKPYDFASNGFDFLR